jgi:hypothetical protein
LFAYNYYGQKDKTLEELSTQENAFPPAKNQLNEPNLIDGISLSAFKQPVCLT